MAVLSFDGFDHYTDPTQVYNPIGGGPSITSAAARFSGGNAMGMRFPQNAWVERLYSATPGPTIFVMFAAKMGGGPPSGPRSLFHLKQGGTVQASLGVDSLGRLAFYRGAANVGTLLGSNSGSYTVGTGWHRYEAKIKIDPSVGTVELRMDGSGTALLSFTSQNTRATSSSFIDVIRKGDCDGGIPNNMDWDDELILDDSGSALNTFLGERKLLTSKPNGAGSSTQFTPSTGSNFGCVDDIPPNDDTDYVSSSTANDQDFYTFETMAFASCDFVGQIVRARKDDVGGRTLQTTLRSGSTNVQSSTYTMLSNYAFYGDTEIVRLDPNTSAAWTQSGVNAATGGPKEIT